MRTIALFLIAFACLVGPLSADAIDFTPFAGYTSVSMGSVNKAQAGYQETLTTLLYNEGNPASFTGADLSGAWILGGDLLSGALTPWKELELGLRVDYLGTNQASDLLSEGAATINTTESGTLTSVMIGGRYQLPGADYGLKLSAGAFAGIGYGTMSQNFSVTEGGTDMVANGFYYGEGFVGDLDLRLDWTVPGVTWLHLDAQGGYRYASLGDFRDGNGQPLEGPMKYLHQFAPTEFPPASAVDVDFSGLSVEGGLSLVF
ncbi:MAG TPA: hypothetical protein VK914_07880 [bacterium]|jgi:hypothetical protein|nr:hypothetical protein [bacterium]